MKTNSYNGYSTNVNFIKFIAAIMVILSHSFPLATGTSKQEWFHLLSKGQYTLGGIAVSIFFFYSGLLITKSLLKNSSAKYYFINRILRIIPPLMVIVIVCAFVMGPIVTSLPLHKYFTTPGTYLYLLNGVLILVHNLPGVFEQNIYLPTVNGSLWTLPIEVVCYVACFLLFKMHLNNKKPLKVLFGLSIVFAIGVLFLSAHNSLGMLYSITLPVFMFFSGILYYVFRDSIKMDYKYVLLAFVIIIVSIPTNTLLLGLYIGFPYILAYLGFSCKRVSENLGNLGKLSYSIYLCAFPIQQCVTFRFGGSMNTYMNMLLSIPLSILGGWILYEAIEKRIPSFKQK